MSLKRFILFVGFATLGCLGIVLSGCPDRKKKNGNFITRKEFQSRGRWAKPRCQRMCKTVAVLCKETLKAKKRKFDLLACTKDCVKNFIIGPRNTQNRLFCMTQAKNCSHVLNCNRCNFLYCERKGKTWIPKQPPAGKAPTKQGTPAGKAPTKQGAPAGKAPAEKAPAKKGAPAPTPRR